MTKEEALKIINDFLREKTNEMIGPPSWDNESVNDIYSAWNIIKQHFQSEK
tara:strand:+ start:205 stop:357 length:153 start_codon:yes stop_codon:yes gene_type:complete